MSYTLLTETVFHFPVDSDWRAHKKMRFYVVQGNKDTQPKHNISVRSTFKYPVSPRVADKLHCYVLWQYPEFYKMNLNRQLVCDECPNSASGSQCTLYNTTVGSPGFVGLFFPRNRNQTYYVIYSHGHKGDNCVIDQDQSLSIEFDPRKYNFV